MFCLKGLKMRDKVTPIFMWAGGKTKMLKHHVKYLPPFIETYSEPFFFFFSMFLYVKTTYNPSVCYINDINRDIMNIYRAIQENPTEFCYFVDKLQDKYIPLSYEDRKQMYYEIRNNYAYNFKQFTDIEEPATLYFLMKTSFNGIWQINQNTNQRFGTPCGLLNHENIIYDKNNIFLWNTLLENVIISSEDYSKCQVGDVNYFDPPYRSSFTKYSTDWSDEDFIKLIEYAENLDGTTIICNRYEDDGFFETNKRSFIMDLYDITYTAGRRKKTQFGYEAKKAKEIVLCNRSIPSSSLSQIFT